MSFAEALRQLGALGRLGIRPGLERTRAALDRLGAPEGAWPAIDVAGTNGKGSTAAMAEAMLRAAGARTGLYTSPHLLRFTERIRVDGDEIGEDVAASLAGRVLALDAGLTFFEAATVMAFLAFAEAGVDVAVIECGLGGRLDATRLCRPVATVITSIGLDHQELLGDTLGAIAAEKAGILVAGIPALVAALPDEAARVVAERARAVGAPLARVGHEVQAHLDAAGALEYDGPGGALVGAALSLAGAHQASNAALALAATAYAPERFRPDEGARRRGLADVRWPGRLERLAANLWVDAAHNGEGATSLAAALPSLARALPSLAPALPSLASASSSLASALPSLTPASSSLAPALPSLASASPSLTPASSSLAPALPSLAAALPSLARGSAPGAAGSAGAVIGGAGAGGVVLLVGVLADKDPRAILAPLVGHAAHVVTTRPPSPRALAAADLAAVAAPLAAAAARATSGGGRAATVEAVDDLAAALARARALAAAAGGIVVACGSLFLVGAVRRAITGEAADPAPVSDPAPPPRRPDGDGDGDDDAPAG